MARGMFKNDPARAAAFVGNLTRYEGRPCPRCEGGERYTSSGACVACAAARAIQRAGHMPTPRYKLKDDTARGAAYAAGEMTFQGRPCVTCTSTGRYVSSGNCVHCAKAVNKQRGDGPRRQWTHRKAGAGIPLEPTDGKCKACGEIAKLVMHHDHGLEALGLPAAMTFKGWVCYTCNRGFGCFGDDAIRMERALNFLKRKT